MFLLCLLAYVIVGVFFAIWIIKHRPVDTLVKDIIPLLLMGYFWPLTLPMCLWIDYRHTVIYRTKKPTAKFVKKVNKLKQSKLTEEQINNINKSFSEGD